MQGTTVKALILGFIAGAIATVTIHEVIKSALFDAGLIASAPWNMEPMETGPFAGVLPKIAGSAFWGGVWGSVLAMILGNLPQGSMTLKGILLGIIGPAVAGVFVLVPLLKGGEVFLGGNTTEIGAVLAILAGWGAVTAWLYGLFSYGRLP